MSHVALAQVVPLAQREPARFVDPHQESTLNLPAHRSQPAGFLPSTAILRLRNGTTDWRSRSAIRSPGTWDSA